MRKTRLQKIKKETVSQYTHEQKRINIPPTGLVTAETDPLDGIKKYKFDPHFDPELQWSGKSEGISFNIDTVSLHVHERIDPLTIIEAVRTRAKKEQPSLLHYFEESENNLPIREAIEFYKHSEGWSNRLIAGDSLLVMNSLLEKEGMAGKIQMIYMDPPYGIKYGSNFQPFVNKVKVVDGKDEDLNQEPEMIKAFRDTWELGIHSYLTYLRNNLLLAKDLLIESGSIFVQISDENLHHVREIMDEIFGSKNFISIIAFQTAANQNTNTIQRLFDYLLWYAKDIDLVKVHKLYRERTNEEITKMFSSRDDKGNRFRSEDITAFTSEERGRLKALNRLISGKEVGKLFPTDFPFREVHNVWEDTVFGHTKKYEKIYVVQTNNKVIQRCALITTDPGDLIFDPTCGSGTTAWVAEKWGRRWITCDTSRISITLAKERLMTSTFDYYELAYPSQGLISGFVYENVPRITLESIAKNESPVKEILYDRPISNENKKRISGPFTVEAVPSQRVKSFDEISKNKQEADVSIARSGETIRQNDWIDELRATGIRGKNGQIIKFGRIETLTGTRWLQAEGETTDGQKAALSFGPDYAPLEQRQVELAIKEAQTIVPKPDMIIFASFQFDPEAAKDIEELKWAGVKILKCQMNTDLLTSDLKKKRSSNESFWLIGRPDIEVKKEGGKYIAVINGFDYYNIKTGEIESGDTSKIAMWELDTDYDGRSLYPRQVFFPMPDESKGWNRLAKTLNVYIDEKLIEKYRGSKSLPFTSGKNKQIAVKIIDDRGIESLRVLKVG